MNRNKCLAMCEIGHKVQWEHSEVCRAGMVKTGFSKDAVPELKLEVGLCGYPSSQREEHVQGHADGGTMLACLGAPRGYRERIVECMAGNGPQEARRIPWRVSCTKSR